MQLRLRARQRGGASMSRDVLQESYCDAPRYEADSAVGPRISGAFSVRWDLLAEAVLVAAVVRTAGT